MNCPKISIIMGIYNCADTLDQAIESILSQTYTNWEFIMCDDASTDNTYNVAKKYVDLYPDKFILIKNEHNMGLNYTLNKCLDVATGEYIARMDGDDISLPERFEKEVNFLLNNPKYAIVSTQMEYFDENGIYGRSYMNEFPVAESFVNGTPFCHAPCMVKKCAYDAVDGYTVDPKLLRGEDYHLWIKLYCQGFFGCNLQEVLYQMRNDRNAFLRRKFKYRLNEAYVKYLAVKMLKLSKHKYIYVFKPILAGLIPKELYSYIHKVRLSKIR